MNFFKKGWPPVFASKVRKMAEKKRRRVKNFFLQEMQIHVSDSIDAAAERGKTEAAIGLYFYHHTNPNYSSHMLSIVRDLRDRGYAVVITKDQRVLEVYW